jgi:hypothetical protein
MTGEGTCGEPSIIVIRWGEKAGIRDVVGATRGHQPNAAQSNRPGTKASR